MPTKHRRRDAAAEGPPTVGDCVAVLDELYPPGWAQAWDAVGLTVGDPDTPVERVLFAIDPTEAVAEEAVEYGAALLVTHHPLFLRGVHGVAETTAGGRVVAGLVRGGCALLCVHTNADVANPGVSDALAAALNLGPVEPVAPTPGAPDRGLGRIGELAEAERMSTFLQRVAAALPATAAGVRSTGVADRRVRRVAVCGGAGGELAAQAAALGADVLVTADARHHHTLDAVAGDDIDVVDVAHWASEWPWLGDAARRLREGLADRGRTVGTAVSARVTDPWRQHAGAPAPAGP